MKLTVLQVIPDSFFYLQNLIPSKHCHQKYCASFTICSASGSKSESWPEFCSEGDGLHLPSFLLSRLRTNVILHAYALRCVNAAAFAASSSSYKGDHLEIDGSLI